MQAGASASASASAGRCGRCRCESTYKANKGKCGKGELELAGWGWEEETGKREKKRRGGKGCKRSVACLVHRPLGRVVVVGTEHGVLGTEYRVGVRVCARECVCVCVCGCLCVCGGWVAGGAQKSYLACYPERMGQSQLQLFALNARVLQRLFFLVGGWSGWTGGGCEVMPGRARGSARALSHRAIPKYYLGAPYSYSQDPAVQYSVVVVVCSAATASLP